MLAGAQSHACMSLLTRTAAGTSLKNIDVTRDPSCGRSLDNPVTRTSMMTLFPGASMHAELASRSARRQLNPAPALSRNNGTWPGTRTRTRVRSPFQSDFWDRGITPRCRPAGGRIERRVWRPETPHGRVAVLLSLGARPTDGRTDGRALRAMTPQLARHAHSTRRVGPWT